MWEGNSLNKLLGTLHLERFYLRNKEGKRQMNSCCLSLMSCWLAFCSGDGRKLPETSIYQLYWKLPLWCGKCCWSSDMAARSKHCRHVASQLQIIEQYRLTESGLISIESSEKADVEMELGVHEVYWRGNVCGRWGERKPGSDKEKFQTGNADLAPVKGKREGVRGERGRAFNLIHIPQSLAQSPRQKGQAYHIQLMTEALQERAQPSLQC